jgi:predicted nucleotidyltransferase
VSGEVPSVALGEGPVLAALVDAVDALATAEVDFVLVGGLAVMARLATVHRATSDLDALSGDDQFVLVCESTIPGATRVADKLVIDDITVDAIIVDGDVSFGAIEAAVDAPLDRLFTAGHRFALDDARPIDLIGSGRRTRVLVADARALLVTKLHAYLSPRRDPAKGGSDALDLVRLGELVVRQPTGRRLTSGEVPALVAQVARWGLEAVASDPARLRRRLRSVGAPDPAPALLGLLLDDLAGASTPPA